METKRPEWKVEDEVLVRGKLKVVFRGDAVVHIPTPTAHDDVKAALIPFADLFPVPDPAAPTVEDVLNAAVERCIILLDDDRVTNCPANRLDTDLSLESGCPCNDCKPPEASWMECWKRVMRKKVLDSARELRAERE